MVGIEPTFSNGERFHFFCISAILMEVDHSTSSPKGWLLYPAYPQHYFSLWGLVHIYIPQTGTPCGRIMGQRSYSLSWAPVFSVALPSPFVPLLYHTLRGLSRGFSNFFSLLSDDFFKEVWKVGRVPIVTHRGHQFPISLPTNRLPSWHPYCITTWAVCQEVFFFF